MKKRVVSLCLLLAMALSMVSPVTALAAEESAASEERETVQVYADTEEENDSGSAEGSEGGEPVEPPAEKQEQVISGVEASYSTVYGAASLTLEPQTNGDGTFSFASDNTDVVAVDSASGEMSFVGAGTASVTITASETETYKAGTAGNPGDCCQSQTNHQRGCPPATQSTTSPRAPSP